MKNLFKMIFVFSLFVLCAFALVGCGGKEKKVISIIEYVSATALDEARDGIIEGLKAQGFVDGENVEIVVYNPQAKADTLAQMCETAVKKSDLIFAIATPVAQALVNELDKQGSNVPVLFTAVTDPVASNIIPNATTPGVNISGTSDINPVSDQVALLKEINPSATKIGFIYTAGENNSIIQLNMAKEAASKLGLEVVDKACTNPTDLEQVARSLISQGIDALYIPTDNDVASQMPLLASICNQAKVITICGESGLVRDGGTLTVGSIDYTVLGKMTGEMGAEVLKGADVSKMSVKYFTSTDYIVNKEAVAEFGLAVPQSIIDKSK